MSLRLVADEDFNNHILRGAFRRNRKLDILRVQDLGFRGMKDPELLEWAAGENRGVLTHDVSTMTAFADQRLTEGLSMAGLVLVPQPYAMGVIIEDLVVLVECSSPEELYGRRIYLPLR